MKYPAAITDINPAAITTAGRAKGHSRVLRRLNVEAPAELAALTSDVSIRCNAPKMIKTAYGTKTYVIPAITAAER